MSHFFTGIFLALQSYLYGIGWLVIAIAACVFALRAIDTYTAFDVRRELDGRNMPFAIVIGLLLFGISFGTLFMAAHL